MRAPLVRMEKRNVSILAGLVALVVASSGLSILLTHRAHADDADSIGVFDVQIDRRGREWVDIIFDKPLSLARAGEIVDPPPATVEPQTTGVWRWRAENVLRFAPAGGFSIGTEYRIALKIPRLVAAGQRFRGDGEVKVAIDRLLIERIVTAEEPLPGAPRDVVLRGEVHFNYAVNPEILITRLTAVDGDVRVPVEILLDGGANSVIAFRSKPLPKGREERTIKIIVDKSVATSAGGQTLESDYVKEVKIGSSEKLAVRDVAPLSGDAESTLKIELSSAVNPDIAAKFVTLKPAVKAHVSAQGNELLFTGPFAPGAKYDVVVGKGLPAIDNAVLEADYATTVEFPDLKPRLDFQSEGMFLSSSGFRNVAIESVNVEKAVLAIDRVYRNNVFYFLANDYWFPHRYYGNDEDEGDDDEVEGDSDRVTPISHTMGDPIARKKLTLRAPHNRKVVTTVSLEPYVSKHEPGLYRVLLSRAGSENATRWILITDLGIVAKRGNDRLTVWVSSFKDLGAVADASISVISDQNQVLATGHTDERGLWSVKLAKKKRPFMIVVQRGADFSFLVFGKTEIDLSPFDVAGDRPGPSGYSAFVYGERDIYRPGETVQGVAVVRDRALAAPPELPLVAKHFDGNDERESFRVTMTESGIAPFALKLPPYARTGHHRVDVIAGKDVIGSYFFQVEEFVPDRIKVEIKPKTKDAAPGEDLVVGVASAYLFGPPAANLAADTRVRLVPFVFVPGGFEGFSFTNGDRKFDPREIANESGTLDAKGMREIKVAIPPRLQVPSSLEAIVTTRVQEQGGRGVSAVAYVPVHPWKRYVGVRRQSAEAPKAGAAVTFEWVSLSKDGKPLAGGALRAELFEDQWHTVLRKTSNGDYDYESTRDTVLLSTKVLPAGAPRGTFTFIASGYRTYRVVVTDPESGASAATEFCAGGWGYSPWAMKNPGRLQLDLDKSEYAPGETAILQVRAPFSGKLLVTVERDEVTYTSIETLAGNSAAVRVPLAAELRPNAFITATLVRAAKDLEPGEAGRAFGAIAVNVDREANRLHPQIKVPTEMRSQRKLPVDVVAEPGAVVTIAAVDEGILQLIAQKTPDPFAHFYRRLALNVATHDIFAQLLPEVRANKRKVAGGSESMDGQAQYVRADSIRRAKPVAYWSGVLRADASGHAKAAFDIPDFNGGVRVMAVVHRGRHFGASEAMVRVHDPLVLTATPPRFVAVGDQVSVPVTLRNDTGRAGRFAINNQQADIANATEKTIYLPIAIPPQPGQIDLAINATGNGESAKATLTIPVRWPLPPESDEVSGSFAQSAAFTDDVKTFMPTSVERTLVISPLPAVRFRGKLTYLLHYPYGCVEQTTSSVFPLLYFGDLAKELDPDALANNDSAAMVREGVRRLGTMQTISGGFAMWPYGAAPWPWGSTYATHFLVEARRAGHQVEPGIYDRALAYVAGDAKAKMQSGSGDLERVVYDLYVLGRAGKADVGMMDYVREHQLGQLDAGSRALLAAAYAAAGNPRAIDTLLANVQDVEAVARASGGNLDSTVRNRALLLLAMLDAAPNDPRIPRIVERLSRDAGDRWWSTQESSLALIALGSFMRRQHATASYSGAVYAGSKMLGTFTATTAVFRNIKSTAPLRVTFNAGYPPGAAYYSLVTRGVRNVASFKPTSAGIKVTRDLLTRDGKPLDPAGVRQGDLLVCVTKVESTNGRLDNVVVQNLIPAGLEVENPRLATTESFTWITGEMSACTNTDIRDDQVLYFVELPETGARTYYTLLRAVTPGVYVQPPVYAEAMYVRANHAVGERGVLVVKTR
jgi:alpha-2-macroglobulin